MLGARILVIFSDISKPQATRMVLEAASRAARPLGVRFALPSRFQEDMEPLPPEVLGGTPPEGYLLFYPEEEGLQGVQPLLTDETHFLALQGPHGFSAKWEQGLCSRYRKLPAPDALLTAMAGETGDGLPPQAFLPGLSGQYGDMGVKLAPGLPVVCGSEPVKTLVVNPAFVFGKIHFLRHAETEASLLSIAAFVAGYQAFALERPLIWPEGKPRERFLQRPGKDALPRANLARFEQLAGFSFEKRMTGLRASLGLFSTEDGYPQQMPPQLLISQRARALVARATHPMPLFVTAFYELPDALRPALFYMIRFSYLRALTHLPLALYAGGRQERALRSAFPNTFSYPDNALLPKSLLYEGMTPMQHFARNKLPLLQRAMNAYPGFSYYAWVDFDALAHPICAQAMPDFSALMDDTVHLATVGGEPDGSFMVAPYRHLKLLVREVQALTQVDAAIKRSFSEQALLKRLMEKFSDMFTLHPMPRKHLLFLTGLDPMLLSEGEKALLKDLPPAERLARPLPAGGRKAPKE